ncbi:MAG TPA: hypothetical protein ENN25_07660 [Euryarchaeota archaeon]|nr:hypothetical protein [Euryarchaeota archaeon]
MPKADKQDRSELKKFEEALRVRGSKTIRDLIFAIVIWLFAVLVFIPLAKSVGREIEIIVSLIFFLIITITIIRAAPGIKNLLDTFSVFPARKYSKKHEIDYKDSLILFRNIIYIFTSAIAYLFYLPFLLSFHSALAGIVLIMIIFFIFICLLKIFSVVGHGMLDWLYESEEK